jgi:hypothetical protein
MTTSDVISIAKISQYLWNESISKIGFFNNNIDPYKARQLYMERKALEYGQNNSLNVEGFTNYVYALCGQNVQVANNILQAGGVGGNVIVGGGGYGVREYSKFATPSATTIIYKCNIVVCKSWWYRCRNNSFIWNTNRKPSCLG